MDQQERRREEIRTRQEQIRVRISGVLERAVADRQFRQQLIENPRAVLGAGNGEIAEREVMPDVPPRVLELRQVLLRQVFERATSDEGFRRELQANPQPAFANAGFAPQLEQSRAELPQEEVQGFGWTWNTTLWGSIPAWLATGTAPFGA